MSGGCHRAVGNREAGRSRRRLAVIALTVLAVVATCVALAGGGLLVRSLSAVDAVPLVAASSAGPAPTLTSATPTVSATTGAGVASLVDASWVAETAEVTGIPARALAAYAGVAVLLRTEQPGCGLDWATLAGIGDVESVHGTVAGGSIDADGQQTPALVGIALDGTASAAIADTDEGALDGDTTWDRAVGPMQIIPDTWRRYAADGNGDGTADPQQIDDAALAAGRYLCVAADDLTQPDRWIAAVAAYNASADYNNLVAAATDRYRAAG
ncbi:MAG TPA: lytic transglycosylase domain-containing protein [Cellulomonas sp.]